MNRIKNRIAKIVGKTIKDTLATTIMTNKGDQTKYEAADLEYDKQKNFVTINDTIKRETEKRTHQQKKSFPGKTNSQKMSGDANGNLSDNREQTIFLKHYL